MIEYHRPQRCLQSDAPTRWYPIRAKGGHEIDVVVGAPLSRVYTLMEREAACNDTHTYTSHMSTSYIPDNAYINSESNTTVVGGLRVYFARQITSPLGSTTAER